MQGLRLIEVLPPVVQCASCGFEASASARFCASCGRPIGTALSEERKVVTVLFADLAGFTTMAEARDPEAVKDVLDRCFARLVPVVVSHGGSVDKIIGDELMAVFGVPVAHENDPDRAVRAALELIEALREFSSSLVLRIGVNTGEVLVGPLGPGGASTVTGDTVNTAHRLASVARRGEILVGERTWSASETTIEYQHRPPYELRGRKAVERAMAAVGAKGATGGRAPMPEGCALIGRATELEQLCRQSDQTLERSEPTVVVVTGEPGLGKSRLALEFTVSQWNGRDRRVAWTTCAAYGRGGLEPVAEIVRAILDIDGAEDRSTQSSLLAERVASLAPKLSVHPTPMYTRLSQLLGIEDDERPSPEPEPGGSRARLVDRLLAAAHQALRGVALDTPLLVVADDLQWADDAVLDFIEQIPARVGHVPLLVLALGRDELLERRSGFRSGTRDLVPLPLRSLRRTESSKLLAALLVDRNAGAQAEAEVHLDTEDRILAAAGGNPLLLEQVVRYLGEAGSISMVEGRWQLRDDHEGVGIPDGVRSLIGARLDTLPPHERNVIQHASVIGRRFWADGVQELVSDPDVDASAAIAGLMDRGLIESVRHDPRPGDFAFRHVLTRDVTYAGIPLGDRARQHAGVARWLTQRFPEQVPGSLAGLLAHHYERAVMINRELDHTDPGIAAAAFAAMVGAAREAERRDATREAELWYQRARQLGTLDAHLALEIMLSHAIALIHLRRMGDARNTLDQLRIRAATMPTDDERAGRVGRRALAWLAAACRLAGDQDAARELFEAAQAAARAAGDLLGEADAVRLAGWSELSAGRARVALPRLRRAAELERMAGTGRRAETLQALGWSELAVGEISQAQTHLWKAAISFAADDDRGQVSWSIGILCLSFLQSGQRDHADRVAANLIAVTRANGDPWGEALCTVLLGACRAGAGEVESAESLARDGLRRFDEVSEPWGQVMAHLVLGMVSRLRGRCDEARDWLSLGLETARRVTYVGEDARLLAELAGVEADSGNHEDALRRARAALALVRSGLGDQDVGLRALLILAELRTVAGDLDEAQLLLEEAVSTRAVHTPTETWRQASARLAMVLCEQGDRVGALERLAAAEAGPTETLRTTAARAEAQVRLARADGRTEDAAAIADAILDHHPSGALTAFDGLRRERARAVRP